MNDQPDSGINLAPRRKGPAIASLVMGILSFLLFSLFLIGALVGIVLGILALRKASKQPQEYEGKGLAIAGIVLSAVSIVSTAMIAAIAIPNLLKPQQSSPEAAALREVQAIGTAQLQYSVTKGRGRYASLRTLAEEGMIDAVLGSGQKSGYVFTSEPQTDGRFFMFDTTARPVSSGTGNRAFYSNETFSIYESTNGELPSATPQNRVPQNGSRLQ